MQGEMKSQVTRRLAVCMCVSLCTDDAVSVYRVILLCWGNNFHRQHFFPVALHNPEVGETVETEVEAESDRVLPNLVHSASHTHQRMTSTVMPTISAQSTKPPDRLPGSTASRRALEERPPVSS